MKHVYYIILRSLFILLCFQNCSVKIDHGNGSSKTLSLAEKYIQAYWNKDLNTIKSLLTNKSIFIDETAAATYGMKMPVIGSDIISGFQSSFDQVKDVKVSNLESFSSGEYTVFYYHTKYNLNMQTRGNDVVTIIKTDNDKVVEHREYANYRH